MRLSLPPHGKGRALRHRGLLRGEHVSCLGGGWEGWRWANPASQWGRRYRMAVAAHLSRNRLPRTCRDQASRVSPTHPAANVS